MQRYGRRRKSGLCSSIPTLTRGPPTGPFFVSRLSMSTDHDRDQSISLARELQEVLSSVEHIPNADHRAALAYDKIHQAVSDICANHSHGGAPCFSEPQVKALKEMAFQIAFILDPVNRAPRTISARAKAAWRRESWGMKVSIVLALIVALVAVIDLGKSVYEFGSWAVGHKPPAASNPPTPNGGGR